MIQVTQQVITPTLYLVLEWSAVPHAVGYAVSLKQSGHTTVEYAATSTLLRIPNRLCNAEWHWYQVTALDALGEELATSAITPVYASAQTGTAPLLRQAVYDVLAASSLLTGVAVINDGYHRPRAWGRTTAPTTPYPAVEVGCPSLTATEPYESNTQLCTWDVPITVRTVDSAGDADNYSDAWLIAEKVQAAIDLSNAIEMPGVLPQQYSWSAELQSESKRTKTTELECTLTVPVRKVYGVILIPDYDVRPAQPVTPAAL